MCPVPSARAQQQPDAPSTTSRLVVATPTPYDTLDPHVVLDTQRAASKLFFYDALFRWQSGPVRVAPWLAEAYTQSEDGKVLRFTLQKAAKFHDGRAVKASDVVYSVERILALKRGAAPVLAGLVSPGSTKAIDASTVEFNLTRPSTFFLTLLPEIHVVNADLLKANEVNNDWGRTWLASNEAGSGAFALKSFEAAEGFTAVPFPGHWTNDVTAKPVAEIVVKTVVDPEARVQGLIKGEFHIVEGQLLPHQVRALREAKDIAVAEADDARLFAGLLNSGREPLKSLVYRQALAKAFDVSAFIASTLPPGATPLTVPLPPQLGTPTPAVPRVPFDLAAAKAELAKVKAPTRDLLIGAVAGDPHSERAALIMQDGLRRIGVAATVVIETWPVVAGRMRDERQMYDVLFLWQGARYLDGNNFVGEMYDCDLLGAGNSSWYCNRDIDRLIKETRGAADARVRRTGFEKAAAMVAADQAGIFIATARRTIAYSKRVKGLRFSPVGEAIEPRSVTLD